MTFSIDGMVIMASIPLIFVLLAILLLKNIAQKSTLSGTTLLQKKRSLLFKSVLDTYKPLVVLIFFLYVKYLYVVLKLSEKENAILTFLFEDAYFVANVALITLVIIQAMGSFKKRMISKFAIEESIRSDLDNNPQRTKIDALVKLIVGVWLGFSVLLMLSHFGVPISSIVAFGGMGSIVIGFAAKDILSDLVSGFLIYMDGQFDIGEWIKLEQPSLEGTVESIGWRVSRVRTLDDRPLYVPNSLLSKAIIQNVSRRDAMRLREYITISAESAPLMSIICKEIRNDVLLNHDGIDQSRTVIVNLASYQAGVCWIYVSAHTKSADIQGFYGIKQDILIKINSIFQIHEVRIDSPKVSINQKFVAP